MCSRLLSISRIVLVAPAPDVVLASSFVRALRFVRAPGAVVRAPGAVVLVPGAVAVTSRIVVLAPGFVVLGPGLTFHHGLVLIPEGVLAPWALLAPRFVLCPGAALRGRGPHFNLRLLAAAAIVQ